MAERSHYLDILLREPTIGHQLHARLLLAAHARIANGDAFAVSWPDWRQTPGEFGLMFRVFGEPSSLANYAQAVAVLVERGLIRLFPVAVVPETSASVCFVRDRGVDKTAPSRLARLRARAAARGEPGPEIPVDSKARRPRHFLWMQSTTTGQNFALSIVRQQTSKADGARSYGLGVQVPDF